VAESQNFLNLMVLIRYLMSSVKPSKIDTVPCGVATL
jgi:hypothetical protein